LLPISLQERCQQGITGDYRGSLGGRRAGAAAKTRNCSTGRLLTEGLTRRTIVRDGLAAALKRRSQMRLCYGRALSCDHLLKF
jgi:hypothetical protein